MTITTGTQKQIAYAASILPAFIGEVEAKVAEFLAMDGEFSADEQAALAALPAKISASTDAAAILDAYTWSQVLPEIRAHAIVLAAALGEYIEPASPKVRAAISALAA